VLMSQIAPTPSVTRLADPTNSTPALGRVLVVEDDPSVQKALKHLFEAEGYAVEIHGNGQSALESSHAVPPAIIVLDLRLPKLSGRDLCKEVKAESPTLPIVVLSATRDVSDKVLLLELGANDYVTKPFSPQELLARVRAALRHTSRTSNISVVRFDNISVNLKKMEVLRDGEIVVLTALEFKTLQFLVQNPDRVIHRGELLKEVWGYQNYPCHSHRGQSYSQTSPETGARYRQTSTLPHGARDGLQVPPLRSSFSGAEQPQSYYAAF
jgi:DNA-binding response OmpR family regulator